MAMGAYSLLRNRDDESPSRSSVSLSKPPGLRKHALVAIIIVALSLAAGAGGYLAGKQSSREKNDSLVQLGKTPITFEYELDFSGPPSNVTNKHWKSLFPKYGGFFTHPTVGPDAVAFSVFHQLHCLDGIRQAYWAARNGNKSEHKHEKKHSHNGEHSHDGEHSRHGEHSHHGEHAHDSEHSSEGHVRHCFEFIRQSLQCAADTTLERTVKASEGQVGVPGFGTRHVCSDYNQLLDWIKQWETPKTVV